MTSPGLNPLSLPDFSGIDPEMILNVLRLCEQGKGEHVLESFENDFKKLVKADYCVPVSSATSGLHLALLALDIREGDEVICPTFTFAASAFPILYQKAKPVFVDSELDTWNMAPQYLDKAIEDAIGRGQKPKAIIIVHAYGTPAKLGELLTIADHFQIPVIEDSANALGSTYKNQQVGLVGTIGVFSFNRNKIITGGSGGCVVTKDKVLSEKIKYFAHQAKTKADYYLHENIGYNYGLSPIIAEIIRLQFSLLQLRIQARHQQFEEYQNAFQIADFQIASSNAFANRWLTVLKPDPKDNDLVQTFHPHKVWKPLHTQPVFSSYKYFGQKESEMLFETAHCLPFKPKKA